VLDATRCLSYLTIELKGPIPVAQRSALGAHAYGCDICQEVCPWNQKFARALADDSPFAARPAIAGKEAATLARQILAMDDSGFRDTFRGSPMKRAKRAGLERNARVVLENRTRPRSTGPR
jgi:epoxyqueuosine reductase